MMESEKHLYHYSPSPYNVQSTANIYIWGGVLIIALFCLGVYELFKLKESILVIYLALFISLSEALPFIYNLVSSPLERDRNIIRTFIGGGYPPQHYRGSVSWPLHRLLVYEDGLEIRVKFHCFFIPFDKMIKLSMVWPTDGMVMKRDTRLKIESDLPGVPKRLIFSRLSEKGNEELVSLVAGLRNKYLAENGE